MFSKITRRITTSIGGGALLIAFFTIASKIAGLVRDRLLAQFFGASRIIDIYFASFKLPDLIFNILILGALTSAFVPVFQRLWDGGSKSRANEVSASLLNILLVIVGVLTVILWVAAPLIVPLLVPGFNLAEMNSVLSMTRIMLISLIFFTISNIFGAILNSWRTFFAFAISPLFYNLGIIVGIIFLYPIVGESGLAWGVVLGAVLHAVIQFPAVMRGGWRYSWKIIFNEDVLKVIKLMIPRTVGLAAVQINTFVITILASFLTAGSLAVFNYAHNIQSFPVGIFGVSLAIAAFPSFSKAASSHNIDSFTTIFSIQLRRILFTLVPLSFLVLLLRAQIVRVILGSGAFDWEATRLTAEVLGFFSLSLVSQGIIPLLARSFYAFEDTKTPVRISMMALALNIVLSIAAAPYFGVIGLAAAFTLANIMNMILLYRALHQRLGDLDDRVIIFSASRIVFISIISASITYGCLQIMPHVVNTRTFVGIFLQGFISGSLGLGCYLLLSILLKLDEIHIVRSYITKLANKLR